MKLTGLPDPVAASLQRPEMRLVAEGIAIRADPDLVAAFQVPGAGQVVLGTGLPMVDAAFALRHALELALLLRLCPDDPALAGLAAARTASLFCRLEQICRLSSRPGSDWVAALDGDAPPGPATAARLWRQLAVHQPGADPALSDRSHARLVAAWALLGPAEWLMETGGDVRLRVDPETGLNGYGCSHRPRPWAITYASSTASSVSERGYAGAEASRRRLLAAALGGGTVEAEAAAVRAALRAHYALPDGAEVILAASGTDCELIALALAQLRPDPRPLTSLLVAPEETGSGVPMAAVGRHFAVDTARGLAVPKGDRVEGYRTDTILAGVALRDRDGRARPADRVDADCTAVVAAAPGRCLLHLLDVSKTGLLAPGEAMVRAAQASRPGEVDVVVDACQARVSAGRVRGYVAAGWMVLVTGSKFFTGPPFAGAVLVPAAVLQRLDGAVLPGGLHAYTARTEWLPVPAAAGLPEAPNVGLILRWQAALAEMRAFHAVPASTRRAILEAFTARVRAAIVVHPDLELIEVPCLARPGEVEDWDLIGTIISFALRDPATGVLLDPEQARRVYGWLNADLAPALPDLPPAERGLAGQRCHLGQPVPLPGLGGGSVGALRLSAGARLVSGEPSHAALGPERLEREIADALRVLAKASLILRHRDRLESSGVRASFL